MIKLGGKVCGEIVCIISQYLPQEINHKGNFSNFKWKNLAETTLTK